MLGMLGPSSNSPCPWCKLDRQQTTNAKCLKGNSVRTLLNYDEFYEKAEPRLLSDWDDEKRADLRPINSVLKRFMIASGIERIDEFIQPGNLHFKLAWNGMFEKSIDPKKWIINFKHKCESATLTKEEKQLEDACRQIESSVVEIRPRRHGIGSDSEYFFINSTLSNDNYYTKLIIILSRQRWRIDCQLHRSGHQHNFE